MKIDVDRCELVAAPAGNDRFEAVRERIAPVLGPPRKSHDALRHAIVPCRTGEHMPGRICSRCNHLLNAVPASEGDRVLVRCVFFESDPVESLMIRAEDLITVRGDATTAVAAALLLDRDVHHLVVVASGRAIALLGPQAIEGRQGSVADHIGERIPVVARTMELGAAARAFRARNLDAAGVVDGHELVGVLTRDEMRAAGIPGI